MKQLGRYNEAERSLLTALNLLPPVIPGQPYMARIAPAHLSAFITLAKIISAQDMSRSQEVEALYKRAISMRSDFIQVGGGTLEV